MAGVVDDRKLRRGGFDDKFRNDTSHIRIIEIIAVDHLKPDLMKCIRDRARVIDGIGEPADLFAQ